MSSEINPINKKLAIISGNGDLPFNILESAVSNDWNGVVIDIANKLGIEVQKVRNILKSYQIKFSKNSI